MKKFFANLALFLAVLLNGIIVVPFNNLAQWGLNYPIVTTYEIYIKAGVAGLMFILAFIFLIVSIKDERNYGEVKPCVAQAAIIPPALFGISMLGFSAVLLYFIWRDDPTTPNLIVLAGAAAGLVNAIAISHLVIGNFRTGGTAKKIALFLFAVELLGVGGYAGFLSLQKTSNYASLYTYNYPVAIAAFVVFYIIHLILEAARRRRELANEGAETETEVRPAAKPAPQQQQVQQQSAPAHVPARREKGRRAEPEKPQNRTIIVDSSQSISTGEKNVDPTSMLFEDVDVDPEFNKTANLDKQVSSIEYYIEKPKMFKPLDPTFDQLVAYVRELPNVVTKLAEDRITFYVDRKPFLVLMNFGNYYRLAFRSELEKGIRMIIKYPTISKNKGTKDNLWFKANNYGDLPKEIVYDIAKSAYDNVHA